MIARYGDHGGLVDDVSDACAYIGKSKPSAQQEAVAQRRTVLFTAEDFLVEGKGIGSGDYCARTLLDFTRIRFNTTMLVPTPPIQQFTLTTDHVRLLLTEASGPYTTLTEHSFVQVRDSTSSHVFCSTTTIAYTVFFSGPHVLLVGIFAWRAFHRCSLDRRYRPSMLRSYRRCIRTERIVMRRFYEDFPGSVCIFDRLSRDIALHSSDKITAHNINHFILHT